MISIRKKKDGVLFTVYVQPRSSKNAVAGQHGDALKIRLTAPPVDGEANRMCIRFLAKALNIPRSEIEITSGRRGRTKQVLIRCSQNQAPAGDLVHKIKSLVDLKK